MNQKQIQPMRGFRVVVLPLDAEPNLVSRLVGNINESAGSDIALTCEGSPKGILRKADKYGIGLVVFYGAKEVQEGNATVRDMTARTQMQIPLMELPGYLASRYPTG